MHGRVCIVANDVMLTANHERTGLVTAVFIASPRTVYPMIASMNRRLRHE